MAISKASITPAEFLNRFCTDVVKQTALQELTPAELQELEITFHSDYSVQMLRWRFVIRWRNGYENMRQLDLHIDDIGRQSLLNETAVLTQHIERAMEHANMRGELQFHRLAKRIPGKVKQVICGPRDIGRPGDPDNLAPGEMIIIFSSGAELRCTELEASSEEAFIAKCLMLSD